jgi:hypothetical protein
MHKFKNLNLKCFKYVGGDVLLIRFQFFGKTYIFMNIYFYKNIIETFIISFIINTL